MRAGYDEYGRAETITDKSLCNFDNASGVAGQAVVYTNIYSDDGELKRVNISGEISGSFSEITDDTGKVISKTVECFGEQKIYGYKYDNYFGNDYPDNRLSKILLPGDTAVRYDYDEYSRLTKREITPYNSVSKVIESYAYLLGGEDLNCGCKDRETNYVSSIFCQSVGYSTTTSYTYDMVIYDKRLFLSIESAERLNARLLLLFAVQIDFYAKIFDRKEQYEF